MAVRGAASRCLQTAPRPVARADLSSTPTVARPGVVSLLRRSEGDVFLVGTAHVSEKSGFLVRSVIDATNPRAVMVELCSERAVALKAQRSQERSSSGGGASSATGSPWEQMTRHYAADMAAGLEHAEAHGAVVVLGDRRQSETKRLAQDALARMGGLQGLMTNPAIQDGRVVAPLMSTWGRVMARLPREFAADPMSLMAGGMAGGGGGNTAEKLTQIFAEVLKDRALVREMVDIVGMVTPDLLEALLHSRDDFMFKKMNGELLASSNGGASVVVVGLAHMDGLEERWADKYGPGAVTSGLDVGGIFGS
uniref:TraB domain-containing protein n=1 Tax=Florenciella parvula TaxID=236787 RepID=A0A7S2GAE8_9STRA